MRCPYPKPAQSEVAQFQVILGRINQRMKQDQVVQGTTDELRRFLQVDRVVLYYFFAEWEGRVTFESLSDQLWGLLVAHHCQGTRNWTPVDVDRMEQSALVLANASSINTH
ncbi:MAG: hypothetical protein DCF25_12035 [Leptolyngbya foveolarum]|uniref:Phytochrome chromophore attachment site domain-containing protein n=1 Tax=Leptolyngbya foveolarum TaxID=47253 RepID=A0A2W4U776_9CYAN|nr:MAG: hypothetical protein DCF25_12035 [Leptolyngbya foveolarum]